MADAYDSRLLATGRESPTTGQSDNANVIHSNVHRENEGSVSISGAGTDVVQMVRNTKKRRRFDERRGRPAKAIWTLFDRIRDPGTDRITRARCKFCGECVAPRPAETMLVHARYCISMKDNCDPKLYESLTTGPSTIVSKRVVKHQPIMFDGDGGLDDASAAGLDDLTSIAANTETSTGVESTNGADTTNATSPALIRKTQQGDLKVHGLHGGEELTMARPHKLSTQKAEIDMSVMRFFIANNLPLATANDQSFRTMVQLISDGSYRVPTGKQLTKLCLSSLSRATQHKEPKLALERDLHNSRAENSTEINVEPQEEGSSSALTGSSISNSRVIATSALAHAAKDDSVSDTEILNRTR